MVITNTLVIFWEKHLCPYNARQWNKLTDVGCKKKHDFTWLQILRTLFKLRMNWETINLISILLHYQRGKLNGNHECLYTLYLPVFV